MVLGLVRWGASQKERKEKKKKWKRSSVIASIEGKETKKEERIRKFRGQLYLSSLVAETNGEERRLRGLERLLRGHDDGRHFSFSIVVCEHGKKKKKNVANIFLFLTFFFFFFACFFSPTDEKRRLSLIAFSRAFRIVSSSTRVESSHSCCNCSEKSPISFSRSLKMQIASLAASTSSASTTLAVAANRIRRSALPTTKRNRNVAVRALREPVVIPSEFTKVSLMT